MPFVDKNIFSGPFNRTLTRNVFFMLAPLLQLPFENCSLLYSRQWSESYCILTMKLSIIVLSYAVFLVVQTDESNRFSFTT